MTRLPADAGRPTPDAAGPQRPVVVLRPFATPLPIGLMGLTVGSVVLSGDQLGWYGPDQQHAGALCLLGFVVPLQFISFVFALMSRDEGASSAMAILAGSWAAISLVTLAGAPGLPDPALGVLLAASGAVLLLPATAAGAGKPLVGVVLGLAAVRFLVSSGYELSGSKPVEDTAGVLGVVLAVFAFYAAASFALEAISGRPVIPTLRRTPPDAVDEGEPGVRRKL